MKTLINFVVFAGIFLGCNAGSTHHMAINDKKGFDTVYSLKSKELKIDGWHKPYVLFFFTTSCAACKEQVPILNEISKELGDKVKFVGVLGDARDLGTALEAVKEKNITFITVSSKKSVEYFSNAVGGVMGSPLSVIFDKDGKIVKRFLGLYPKAAFIKELNILID